MDSGVKKTEGLDLSTPIDHLTAIHNLGGDTNMYFMLLARLEEMSLLKDTKGVSEAFEQNDFQAMKDNAHSLKSAAGYAGAGRLQDSCYWIQSHFMAGNYEGMAEQYPLFIANVIEVRVYLRKLLAIHKGEGEPEIGPEIETVSIA